MRHVTGEQLQRVLNPVLEQCDEVLRRNACLRLPPVYPRLLELTDAGPGVGVSSAESRIRILEKARIHGNEKVLRIHRAREDSGQNEAERLNACIGDALCDEGSLKWQIYETLQGLSEEEVKSLSTTELDAHSIKVMEKMRGLLLRKCVFELMTPQRHEDIFQHFWPTDQKINFSTTVST